MVVQLLRGRKRFLITVFKPVVKAASVVKPIVRAASDTGNLLGDVRDSQGGIDDIADSQDHKYELAAEESPSEKSLEAMFGEEEISLPKAGENHNFAESRIGNYKVE